MDVCPFFVRFFVSFQQLGTVGYALLTQPTSVSRDFAAPMAQIDKSLFGSFSSEKELSYFLTRCF
jgi:hypothetical protein